MPGFTDYKLRYQITGDASQLKSEIRETDGLFGKLGSAGGISFGAIAGGATAAAGAIAAMGAASVAIGQTFFSAVRSASDFASALFDATQKTGLTAEAISTLKFNAEAAGSSLDAVTGGVAKFSKLIFEAANGSKEANQSLKLLGVTTTDTTEALNQAFKTISKMPDGVAQMAAAQKAFGKAGADLIPVIKQINGNLDESIQRGKELGIVFTEEDLRAADDFGDTLGFLGTQFEVLSSRALLKFAPQMTQAMQYVTDAIAGHSKEIENGLTNLGYAIKGVEVESKTSTANSIASWAAWGVRMIQIIDPVQFAIAKLRQELTAGLIQVGKSASTLTPHMAGGVSPLFGMMTSGGPSRAPRGGGGGPREKTPEQLAAEAERAEQKRISGIRKGIQEEIEVRAASIDVVRSKTDADLQQGIINEQQALAIHQKLTNDFLQFKLEKLDQEEAAIDAVQHHQEESDRILHDKQILNLKVEEELNKQRQENSKAYEERLQRQVDLWQDMIDKMNDAQEELARMNEELASQYEGAAGGTGVSEERNPFWQAIFGGLGFDEFQSNIETAQQIIGDFGEFTIDIFGQMANAVGQAIVGWALYGESIGTALRKATAAVLAQVAAQAAVKAIFELAEGFAALAVGNVYAATQHFTAAAIYGTVAVGAAVGARLIGGGGGRASAGGRGSSGYAGGSASSGQSATPSTYSRQSQDAFISGRRSDPATAALAASVDALASRIGSMRPGDVVTAGVSQKPGLIGDTYVKDVERNAAIGVRSMKAMGVRS